MQNGAKITSFYPVRVIEINYKAIESFEFPKCESNDSLSFGVCIILLGLNTRVAEPSGRVLKLTYQNLRYSLLSTTVCHTNI